MTRRRHGLRKTITIKVVQKDIQNALTKGDPHECDQCAISYAIRRQLPTLIKKVGKFNVVKVWYDHISFFNQGRLVCVATVPSEVTHWQEEHYDRNTVSPIAFRAELFSSYDKMREWEFD